MKKNSLLCLVSTIVAISVCVTVKTIANQGEDPFTRNLEALARVEIVGGGTCCDSENSCMFKCPGCGNLVYGLADKLGPVKTYNCTCGHHYVKP